MEILLQRLRAAASPRSLVPPEPASNVAQLLRDEHHAIRQLLDAYDGLVAERASDAERQELASRICLALALHAVVEEDVVYPVACQWPACQRALAEAEVEHAAARTLIGALAAMDADDPLFDAHVSVLSAYVRLHFAQEEAVLLPELTQHADDLPGLAARMQRRRQALQQDLEALDVPDAQVTQAA